METLSYDIPANLDPSAVEFYGRVVRLLRKAGIQFLIGGGYAFSCYTDVERDTKDFDIFVLPDDAERVLKLLRDAGYRAETKFPHWLGKVYHQDRFVDVIYNSGNGVCDVDQEWFEHARDAIVLGQHVKLIPVEEMIWQKAFIMERHRYDGADVVFLLHHHAELLSWERLLRRFEDHWLVLLSHLILYRFAFPFDRALKADAAIRDLLGRVQQKLADDAHRAESSPPLCRGTLLSLLEYLPYVQKGYRDARLWPTGGMSASDIAHWTNAFHK